MNNRQTEKSVRRGFTNATPDNLAEIKANCQSTSPTRRAAARTNYWRYATCALAFVLLVVSVFGIVGLTKQGAVTASAATVSLDVNPSLEINVNKDGKVIEVIARNEDAEQVISGLDFSGCSLDVAVYALVGSMYSKGYLSEMSNSVLIDVETNDANKEQLEQSVKAQIDSAMKNNNVVPNVIVSRQSDNAEENNQTTDLVATYDLSVAKARLVVQILRSAPDGKYSVEQLVKLKINDLALILNGIDDNNGGGAASSGSYIGADVALDAAKDYIKAELGVTVGNIVDLKVKLDYEDGRMVYEVEFKSGNFEYECEVVAAKTSADSGTVFKLEVKSTAKKAERPDGLTDEQIETIKQKIKSDALKIAGIELPDQDKVDVTFEPIDENDDEIELSFVYEGTKYEFGYDFSATLVKYEREKDNGGSVDIDYSSRLNVIIRDKLLFLKLGDIDLKWKIDEQKGTVVEYESTYVSELTGLKYEFEVKIDTMTGAVIKIDYEVSNND